MNGKITTLQELADFINANDKWDASTVNEAIFGNGWVDDTRKPNGVCHNGSAKVIIGDDLVARVA